MEPSEFEISLFPIPESIALPFSVVPLHIFEPRYRTMVAESIQQGRRIGVAHTLRVKAPSTFQFATKESELLNIDQETYEACHVFSAGFAEVTETMADGRLLVQIQMDNRFEVLEFVQEAPYQIVRCREYLDQPGPDESAAALRAELDQTLMDLPGEGLEPLKKYVQNPVWKSMSNLHYSFAIYALVNFEANLLQKVLEMNTASDRILFMQNASE